MNLVSELETPWQSPPQTLAGDVALFHDIDGSLLEIAPNPDQVVVAPYLPALLGAVRNVLDGALAVVTGRPLETIDQMLAPLRLAGAGLHGAEIRRHPEDRVLSDHTQSPQGLAEALHRYFADDPRLLIEDKGITVALHYRHAPERASECEAVVSALASAMGFTVTRGKMVVEVLPPEANKGQAVRMLMESPPFLGRRPVFVGDDRTDEDGILVVQAMGGFGVKVGEGASAARYYLPSVHAVHRWLAQAARMPMELP